VPRELNCHTTVRHHQWWGAHRPGQQPPLPVWSHSWLPRVPNKTGHRDPKKTGTQALPVAAGSGRLVLRLQRPHARARSPWVPLQRGHLGVCGWQGGRQAGSPAAASASTSHQHLGGLSPLTCRPACTSAGAEEGAAASASAASEQRHMA